MAAISVVMPTYNTDVPLLREAVDSILNQTIRDFEFIIIDDGSTTDAKEYLNELTDPRIRIIRNETNRGITKSLNIGFRAARGKYIARMDSDDISLPERFEKQLAFMENNPDVIVCGSKAIDAGKKPSPSKNVIEDMENYRVRLLFTNPGPVHPTAFFDRAKLIQHHIEYDERLTYAQDYGMWVTVSKYGRVCILPDILVCRQKHPNQISIAHREKQIACDKMTQRILLTQLLDEVTEAELDFHYYASSGFCPEAVISRQVAEWYDRLLRANKEKKIYNQRKLEGYIVRLKINLIEQTFTKNMSKQEKAMLIFRYLPFSSAVMELLSILSVKLKQKIVPPNYE